MRVMDLQIYICNVTVSILEVLCYLCFVCTCVHKSVHGRTNSMKLWAVKFILSKEGKFSC